MTSVQEFPEDVKPGLVRLGQWLEGKGYHIQLITYILAYVAREGTVAGTRYLDPRDEEWAEHEYVEGLEVVPGVAPEWDEHCTDPGRGPIYNSVGADYTLDHLGWWLEVRQLVPSITGGAPTAEEAVETVRRWYRENPSFADWLEANGGER